MREGWKYLKLLEICDIQYGYPFDSARFTSNAAEGMPLIRIRDVKGGRTETFFSGEFPKEYLVHKGEYLIGMDGEFNIAPWQSEDALLNQRVCKVKSKNKEVEVSFIFRFLTKELKRIEDETPFVTVKHLSAKRLDKVYLSVPPLPEQQRIVSELDLLSSIIDKQKAQLKELDTLCQSIFYDMFGDPVENEKGWEVKKLGDLCEITSSKRIFAEEYVDEGIPFYRSKEVIERSKGLPISVELFISSERYNEVKSQFGVPTIGDILITAVGTIGKIWTVNTSEPFYFKDGNLVWLRKINRNIVNSSFFRDSLVRLIEEYKKVNANGAAYNALTIAKLKEMKCVLPPLPLQHLFAQKIQAIESQKAAISSSLAETQKLFDYTMDKYFG